MQSGEAFIDDEPLLIYHFQSLRIYGRHLYEMYPGHFKISKAAVRYIYRPYVSNLRMTYELLGEAKAGFRCGIEPFATNPRLLANKVKRVALGINNLIVV